ncbi:MAG: M24 family metallopeptidase, partial [Proteobacteria bacterium]|nr:M24 family metallopeptidase [Pseudomonadota bacterium]
MGIQLKTKSELEIMRRANMIVYEVLQELAELAVPGVSTKDIDTKAAELTKSHGALPAFLDYPSGSSGVPAFSGVICASVNEAIVHGLPNSTPLKEGDILSIDYGCVFEGYYGDSAITVPIGKISAENQKLLDVTK